MSPTTRHDAGGRTAVPGGDDVGSYVAAVRARLDDLAPDEVEELTGGLEADLAEALAGFDETPRERFGDPAAYADELRAAADLPPRREASGGGLVAALDRGRQEIADAVDLHLATLQRLPWFAAVRDFLVVLRPAWWVLRAWVLVVALRLTFGPGETGVVGSFPAFVLLLLAVVGSVMLGLRSPPRHEVARALLLVANVVALLALPLAADHFSQPATYHDGTSFQGGGGLSMDGVPVQNVIPYDAQGRRLQGVQLYDEQGRPLQVGEEFRWYSSDVPPQRWNVFPLATSPPEPDEMGLDATPAPTATPGATTTATPSAAASVPTAAPTTTSSTTPTTAPSTSPAATVTVTPTK